MNDFFTLLYTFNMIMSDFSPVFMEIMPNWEINKAHVIDNM